MYVEKEKEGRQARGEREEGRRKEGRGRTLQIIVKNSLAIA